MGIKKAQEAINQLEMNMQAYKTSTIRPIDIQRILEAYSEVDNEDKSHPNES